MISRNVRYYVSSALICVIWCVILVIVLVGPVPNRDTIATMKHSFYLLIAPFLVSGLAISKFGKRWILEGREIKYFVGILMLPFIGAIIAGLCTGIEMWLRGDTTVGSHVQFRAIKTALFYSVMSLYYPAVYWYLFIPLSFATVTALRWVTGCQLYQPIEWTKHNATSKPR